MNVFRAERLVYNTASPIFLNPARLRAAALTVVLLGASAGISAAQEQPNAPISLFPPTVAGPEAPSDDPAAGQGLPARDGPAVPETTLGETPQYEGIQVDKLQELDSESLGILEPGFGGLGIDAWAGSDRGLVERLIAALPDDPASPALRGLTTRLLLSNAQAPERRGAAAGAGNTLADAVATSQNSAFLRLRAQRLYAMGELAGLNRLLGIVPQRLDDSWLAQARVDGLLLQARDEEACGLVRSAVARFPAETYWARGLVFCQFVAEQRDQAFLALDLLREQDPNGDPAFYAASNLFIGGKAEGLAAEGLTPLTLAMLRVGAGEPPADLAETAPPLLLHGLAALPKASATDKAGALERLVQAAILPGDELATAYNAISFEESELTDPLVQAEQSGGIRGRALLFHAAGGESIVSAKAEFLLAAVAAADKAGRGYAMARAILPQLETLSPGLELAWFAPAAVRSLYRVGQFERAAAWAAVLRLDGVKNPESQAAFEAVKPYARLAGGSEPLAPSDGDLAGPVLQAMVLSRALGQPEPNAWPGILDNGDAGSALGGLPRLLALGDAAAAGRRGETVLLAALSLGDGPAGDNHPLALGYAVSALSTLGLGSDARALALEAALDSGADSGL
ncbi:hypothetical protein HBA54_24905 [Pelagibius litoralis]|uniref:Tetratricopeptide repeat-containing protein n=1 Tax=Pelagibius litoralis TaxID=374515 RepID=A0A967F2S0_9PROT|nr:hypothetical protein [Pelagibius litoralis]NIA71841.1 hypothetical protein [Pelagibius litoralis]